MPLIARMTPGCTSAMPPLLPVRSLRHPTQAEEGEIRALSSDGGRKETG